MRDPLSACGECVIRCGGDDGCVVVGGRVERRQIALLLSFPGFAHSSPAIISSAGGLMDIGFLVGFSLYGFTPGVFFFFGLRLLLWSMGLRFMGSYRLRWLYGLWAFLSIFAFLWGFFFTGLPQGSFSWRVYPRALSLSGFTPGLFFLTGCGFFAGYGCFYGLWAYGSWAREGYGASTIYGHGYWLSYEGFLYRFSLGVFFFAGYGSLASYGCFYGLWAYGSRVRLMGSCRLRRFYGLWALLWLPASLWGFVFTGFP